MSLQENSYIIAGNLAADPQHRFLPNDRGVCNFTIITNRRWKNDAGELQEEATAVRCTAWGKTADFVAGHFSKGQAIYAKGRLKQETWEKEGQKHSTLVLVVEEVKFVTSAPPKTNSPRPPAPAPKGAPAPTATAETVLGGGSDEPPF